MKITSSDGNRTKRQRQLALFASSWSFESSPPRRVILPTNDSEPTLSPPAHLSRNHPHSRPHATHLTLMPPAPSSSSSEAPPTISASTLLHLAPGPTAPADDYTRSCSSISAVVATPIRPRRSREVEQARSASVIERDGSTTGEGKDGKVVVSEEGTRAKGLKGNVGKGHAPSRRGSTSSSRMQLDEPLVDARDGRRDVRGCCCGTIRP